MIGGHPVAETVQHHIAHNGIVAVHGVPAAAEVIVIPVGCQQVIGAVVNAAVGDGGAVLISLRRVVENHIQDDLNSVLMKMADLGLQLVGFQPQGR